MTDTQNDLQQLTGKSMDLTEYNIEQLKALFPNVFTEGKIDFEALKSELGEAVEESNERYQFTWAGKEQAKRIATTPTLGTLRPAPEESVNWDSTENLYIEGDNLEVLKLLQKSYFGKVKMIYIDPPYNTGNDFVYKDDFKDNLANYQRLTGQKDEEGNPLTTNSDSSGRYHSNWLNMMYPRLKLARNLLKDDGVIFISIDDNEVHNLRKICDEIFGEGNFVANIAWKHTQQSKNDEKYFSRNKNDLLVYRKTEMLKTFRLPRTEEDNRNYANPDNDPRGEWRAGDVRSPNLRETLKYEIETPNGKKISPPENGWRWSKESLNQKIYEGEIIFSDDETRIIRKIYLSNQEGRTPENVWSDEKFGTTRAANYEIKSIFDQKAPFDTPKPTNLIISLMNLFYTETEDLIIDFFSGSATTAHAVMQLNAQDGGNRKFILAQIPEPTPEKSEARKAGYETIAEIGKERIRRAAKKIKEEHPDTQADLGFKVFKLDTSNIKKWQPNLDDLETDLLDAVDNILPDRTAEDLLYEVLIKYGLPLTLPIENIKIDTNGQTYQAWSVANNSLVACFDENITLDTVQAICDLSTTENPVLRVVFRDTSFQDDITKTNAIQRLKQAGIEDVLSI